MSFSAIYVLLPLICCKLKLKSHINNFVHINKMNHIVKKYQNSSKQNNFYNLYSTQTGIPHFDSKQIS